MNRPNILIFMTDHQQGATMLKENPCITPNIDRFRQKSVTFTHAYCPAPHCCPSRATFFTGLYPSQHGVWNNVNVSNALSRGLYDGVRTFSEYLRDSGYNLYFSGKWHVSNTESPANRGFEPIYLTEHYTPEKNVPDDSEWRIYNKRPIDKSEDLRGEGEIIRPGYPRYRQYGKDENPFGDFEVVQAAVNKLRTIGSEENPFVLYVGPLGPHDPYIVPQRFLDMYPKGTIRLPGSFDDPMLDKPVLYRRTRSRYDQLTRSEQEESLRHYYAFCSYEDYLFGLLMDALEKSGKKEETVVLYVSDHGDYAGAHGLWAKGLPSFREAYHVCAMMGGAGIKNPGRLENALVSLADFAPTFLELAGVAVPQQMVGRSLVSFLKDERPENWRDYCYTQTNGNEIYGIQRAIWNRKWKYVFNSFDYDELYDLEKDPLEMHNLIYGPHPETGPYKEVLHDLWRNMWRFAHQTQDVGSVNPYIMTALAPIGPGILLDEMDSL